MLDGIVLLLRLLNKLGECNCSFEAAVEEFGAPLLGRRGALELVLVVALSAAHAHVAIDAAKRQPQRADHLHLVPTEHHR